MKTFQIAGAILFLLALNCFIRPVNASNLEYYGIESRIQEDMTVLNVVTLTFNSSIASFDYKLGYPVYKISVESELAPVKCDNRVTDTTTISCQFQNYEMYKDASVTINFETDGQVKTVDNNYDYSSFVSMNDYTQRFVNVVYLPQTASLSTDVPSESFSPRNGQTLTNGKHIMVSWDREDVRKGDDVFFSVTYKMPSGNSIGSIYDVGLMIVIAFIIIASLGVYYVRTTRRQDSFKVLMPLMKGDEKVVIDILNKNGGSVNQKVIVRESDFSKAKVSRLIAGLKERGIVGVESMGRMNKITLKIKK